MSYEKKTLLYSVRRALSLHALLTQYFLAGAQDVSVFVKKIWEKPSLSLLRNDLLMEVLLNFKEQAVVISYIFKQLSEFIPFN